MATQLIAHIDTPLLAVFACCIAVLGVAALPWTDGELRRSSLAYRALGAAALRWVKGPPVPRVTAVRTPLAPRRAVRFARSL